ncbi:MAG: virulence RhuM family protein [Prevotella sp.]|nr:virulence RhuM family protein [Prevotella sp.]
MKDEIVLYRQDETIQLEVHLQDETVWLTLNQMAQLFDRDKSVISRHIRDVYKENELQREATVAKNATVQIEGNRKIIRQIKYYNLDVIISVGYRVKSQRGVQFRQWANRVLKEYLLRGYVFNQRLANIEHKIDEQSAILAAHEQKIDFFVRTSLPPVEGIFYDGEIFVAHTFAANLIRSARTRIVLIDNYIDDRVLTLLDKRDNGVSATIYTKNISKKLTLDIQKHNAQFAPIIVEPFNLSHDRFMIIDNVVYHIGASLKDLGKAWFAFTKMNDISAEELLSKIK